jgi:hypothetical protein
MGVVRDAVAAKAEQRRTVWLLNELAGRTRHSILPSHSILTGSEQNRQAPDDRPVGPLAVARLANHVCQ